MGLARGGTNHAVNASNCLRITAAVPALVILERILEPELLDHMDPADPAAVRSRADLLFINRLMGTERWMLLQLARVVTDVDTVIELGAGEGRLLQAIHLRFPSLRCIGYDLIARPPGISSEVCWECGDFMEHMDSSILNGRTVVVANLILHHLNRDQLEQLRLAFEKLACVLVVEPDRSAMSLGLARLLLPFVGSVTRLDMMTSIRAGFKVGELGKLLGKEPVEESVWLGGRRVKLQ